MKRYALYGLVVDSEIDLRQDRPADGPVDLTVCLGHPLAATADRPTGHVMLHYATPERRLYTAARAADGSYVLRFYETADFVVDPTLAHVTVHAVDGTAPDVLAVLTSGTMLSFVLALREAPVLHASAVELDGAAVAFIGSSGMGKSTMATLMCAAGARLITDDVLRIDLTGPAPRCFLGATSLRLRKAAPELSALFATAPEHRVTGDGRDSLTMSASHSELLPLRALVVPVPSRDGDLGRAEVVPLDRKEGLLALLQFPRIIGWQDDAILSRQLQEIGALVETVPVYVARLPWGPPFSGTLAAEVLAGLSVDVDAVLPR